ncbi:MAG TPA: hypothetical protein VJ747_16580 [Stellaceae bacterium]|nr:hypothetical protein [Stellaceae bacterium]
MRARRESASRNGRDRRSFRIWLACLSLLLQLGTAGHFHREDFALIAAGKVTAAAANSVSGAPAQPGGQPTLPTHDNCSLCFSLQLAGSSALPVPILVPAPHEHHIASPPPAPALRLSAAAHLLFQTRAPPTT